MRIKIFPVLEKRDQDREMLVDTYNSKPADLQKMFDTLFEGYKDLATQAFTHEAIAWQTTWDFRNRRAQPDEFAQKYRITHKNAEDPVVKIYVEVFNTTYIETYKKEQEDTGGDVSRGVAVQEAVKTFLDKLLAQEKKELQRIIDEG